MRSVAMLAALTIACGGGAAGQTVSPAAPAAAGPAAATIAGVVRPGMSAADVRAAWGEPAGARSRGAFAYLFYANDCQPACGMQDVVILERGKVVDAIARAPRHRYDGVSSSPASRAPAPTRPASTSTVSPQR